MKIRTKLLLSLSTLPILLLILIGTSVIQTNHLHQMSDALKKNYEIASISERVHTDIKTEAMHLRNLVIFSDKKAIANEINSLEALKENVNRQLISLETNAASTEQAHFIEELQHTNREFQEYVEQVISLVLENKRDEALELMSEQSTSLHDDFFGVISTINTDLNTNLEHSLQSMISDYQREAMIGNMIVAVGIVVIMGILFRSVWSLSSRLNRMSAIMTAVAGGEQELNTKVEIHSDDEIDQVARSFNHMTESLTEQMKREQEQTWVKANLADITTSLSGTHKLEELGQRFLSKVVPLVESASGVFYVKDEREELEDSSLRLVATYAYKERKSLNNQIRPGEGLVGQALLEKKPIILTNVPSDYITVSSGLGESTPLNIYVLPICYEGEVRAILELASFQPYNKLQQDFLEELASDFGIILESVIGRIRLAKLLEESQALTEEVQAQSEELQQQQEELKATNEELEEQTQALRQSEEKLQMQQEELEQANIELEEKAKYLEEQNRKFEQTNKEVEQARAELEIKAEQLALSSKYKSEFLANMSHELRTPLNSLLILSKLLADNSEGNLTEKQLEYSKTIYSSGHDLLTLINDILDLAKIESGKMAITCSDMEIADIVQFVNRNFAALAAEKNLSFDVRVDEDVPRTIYSDELRVQQVLKNLLSNAFKFTQKGEVVLEISGRLHAGKEPGIIFAVKDTGIGISKEKQDIIFEAFQQADGTTSRKYGGTGLGLSISRELATLLGGQIEVDSREGIGSTFTFTLPVTKAVAENEVAATVEEIKPLKEDFPTTSKEDSGESKSHIKRLLIVDDDKNQRNSLMELIGDMDFIMKAVATGEEALEELKVSQFDCMILDLGLQDTSGFEVLEKLCELNGHQSVKVFVYTGRELTSKEELELSKYAHTIIIKNEYSPERLKAELELYLNGGNVGIEDISLKNREELALPHGLGNKKVLLVDDDVRNLFAISSILELHGLEVVFAENGYESIKVLNESPDIDLILMDIMMPEMDGYEAIKTIREMPTAKNLPIIALTAKAMKEDREKCLAAGASDYIVKPIEPDQLISLMSVWLYQ